MPPGSYRRIYIACPANTRTGGPEAMHQLGRALLDLGHDVHMVYATDDSEFTFGNSVIHAPDIASPMPGEFARYDVPRTDCIIDAPGNAVVVPEVWPGMAHRIANAVPYLWWLSIDNGLRHLDRIGGFEAIRATRCIHLCQSYYALIYLRERRISGLPLFDYTSPDKFVEYGISGTNRQDRILYPARGRWFTEWLRRWAPNLPWREVSGFTADQVKDLFLTSRLYVDFGSHPGKDRMPREAAILGCCVITGQRGAAANPFDVPIPDQYKFRDSRLMIPRIARAIRTVLAEYDVRIADFAMYRRTIVGEQREFILQAMRIFGGRLELLPPDND